MACNWLIRISFHCPNLVRIGCNAKILSRFKVYGVMHDPIAIAFDAVVEAWKRGWDFVYCVAATFLSQKSDSPPKMENYSKYLLFFYRGVV